MNNGRNKISTLCNLFESVIGYISISIGLHETSNYLVDLFKDQIGDIYNSKSYFDSKSLLQEKLQELGEELPVYKSQQLENGSFLIKLFINDKKISIGKGRKKIDAEKMADNNIVWGRRTQYLVRNYPLSVMEVFLSP